MALYNEETKIRDLYSILNIPKNATQEEIKNAYKRMCIIYHPDKQLNESLLHNSVKKFNEIKSAYNILSDNRKRAIYDLYGVVDESTGKEVVVFNKYNTEDHKLDYLKRIYEKELIDQFCLSNPKSLAKIVLDVSPLFDQHFTYDSFLEKVLAIKCASFMLLNSVEVSLLSIYLK